MLVYNYVQAYFIIVGSHTTCWEGTVVTDYVVIKCTYFPQKSYVTVFEALFTYI